MPGKNIKYKILIAVIITVLICYSALAGTGIVNGKISDKVSGQPLPGATIRIEGTAYGAVSNKEGVFSIRNLPQKKFIGLLSFVGYLSKKVNLDLTKNDSLYVDIVLEEQKLLTSEVVVSANKRVQAVQDVPISVSVLDYRSMEQRSITLVDEALRYIPGVSLNGDQVSIRGSSGFAFGLGSRVSYLLDGMPLVSGDQGDIKFDAIPIFDIERIEVVKGAGSALYGTGALGGVINLITKEPSVVPEYNAKILAGYYSQPIYQPWIYTNKLSTFEDIELGFSQRTGKLGIILSGGMKKDDSYRKFDDSFKWNLFSKIKYDFSDRTNINVIGSYAYDNFANWVYWNSLDSATIPPAGTDLSVRDLSLKLSLSGELKHIFDNGDFVIIRSGLFSTNFKINLPQDNEGYRSSTANSLNTEIQASSKLFEKCLLTYGLNHVWNSVKANIYGNKSQQIIAGYGQAEVSLPDSLILTLGGRLDYEQIIGDVHNLEFSPKSGVSFFSPWGTKFRVSVGRGFRAATVAEKYASIKYSGFNVVPNPNLIPETSWSYEVGANHEFDIGTTQLYMDVSLFQNEFSNLIEPQFDLSGTGAIKFLNITRARIQGIELDAKALLFGTAGIESSVTLMNPKDLTLNQTLKYRSKILWYTRLMLPFNFFEIQIDHRYLSMIENIDNRLSLYIKNSDARVPVNVIDARLIFRLEKLNEIPLTFTLNVKNLLNYYYLDMVGNLAPFRNISLQVDIKF
jgi:outer membrane receptor for ferrienterochelin and colicins